MTAYAFNNGEQLLRLCQTHGVSIATVMQRREAAISGLGDEAVRRRMQEVFAVMRAAVDDGLEKEHASLGGLAGGEAQKLFERPSPLLGARACRAAAMAMATAEVNAAMGRIVAAPTAGSCGVLPAVLCVGAYSTDQAVDALFTASAVGMIIAQNASVSGAQGGCQAEIGAASAMAAAALCELHGGAPEAALHAAATALQNLMGLVCDPVAGLVEVPCVKRNALGALNALLCADMALCAITTPIPFDQTVGAMHAVGCAMPQSLRESAMGGIAATDAARDIERRLFEPETPIPEDLGR